MSNGARLAFLKGCEGEVCVSYRLPLRAAVAAALVFGAVAAPMAAAACEPEELVVTGGGIRHPGKAEMVRVDLDAAWAPELPVVYDDPRVQPAARPAVQAANPSAADGQPSADNGPPAAPVTTPAAS